MTKLTAEELKGYTKEDMIALVMQMQEALAVSNAKQFGRKSETMECLGQVSLFNETEMYADASVPEATAKKAHGKKKAGKQKENVSRLPLRVQNHELPEEELVSVFGENGWKRLPDKVYLKVEYLPARQECVEHHIALYAGIRKEDRQKTVVQTPHPVEVIEKSLATSSLIACIMNMKYVNAIPLYRMEQEFARNDLVISRANMANWMIRLGEEYLSVLYDHLHSLLYGYHVIQADETPVLVNRDGRSAGSKSYMWVYRSGHMYPEKQIILYEYQRTRNASHPREFLKDYSGICVTDGYQVYHTLEKEREDLIIAGCWVHARRRFDEALAVVPKESRKESASFLIIKQIQAIYREEGKLKELSSKERLVQRQVVVKPLVDALFVYLKQHESEVGTEKLRAAFTYALNQEKYLRVFLTDGDVPMDNNASERAIRGFCVGKKNWQMIDTINGAKSSAIIYSIAETAKANNLKPYEYFEYLLTEIPKHMDDTDRSFLNDLVPWSEKLPENIRKPKN
mgnify:CR=1 FL=1